MQTQFAAGRGGGVSPHIKFLFRRQSSPPHKIKFLPHIKITYKKSHTKYIVKEKLYGK